jgi:hypothetical protein
MAEEFNKLSNKDLVKDSGITDVYEAQFTQMTPQVTAGLNDLDREFATGKIHMDDYNEGLLAGVGALASLHRNLNEGSKIRKNSKGEWEAITVELGNLTEAEQKAV